MQNNRWRSLMKFVDIKTGLDKKEIIRSINSNNVIKGPELWMLICSIMIASLGLDINSPAVIIGGMLISPLMLPILGTGLATGINDWASLKKSATNFGVAVVISIFTSFIYFALTPFGNPTDEILARTNPTFLDILIAFFGGIAGIIAATRKDLSQSIPGVAIATALMPPLCIVGFGLANGHIIMALNAFYLFFLNSFFVALATYLIVRYLRFPYKAYINVDERKKGTLSVLAFMLVLIIPSFFILNKVLTEVRTHEKIDNFIKNEISLENRKFIDTWQLYNLDTTQELLIKLYGRQWDSITVNNYQSILSNKYNLENIHLEIIPSSELDLSHFDKLKLMITEVQDQYAEQIKQFKSQSEVKTEQINELTNELDSLGSLKTRCLELKDEIKILFPFIDHWQLNNDQVFSSDIQQTEQAVFIISSKRKIKKAEKSKIQNFFLKRCKLKEARFIFDQDI